MSKNSGGNFLSVSVNTSDLEKFIDKLGENAVSALRPAAQAAAQVMYEEVRKNVPVSKYAHWFYGTNEKYLFQKGTLLKSIYQVFSIDNSSSKISTYHISWNHKKCPYGFMVEFGTSNAPAHPFIRPSLPALSLAVEASKSVLAQKLMEGAVW